MTVAGVDKCPRCGGSLFKEREVNPFLGRTREIFCLQCGHRHERVSDAARVRRSPTHGRNLRRIKL